MAQQYRNPFAGMDLIAPIEQRNLYDLYCQTGGRTSIDKSPFPRMIDFWFTGMSVAARMQLQPSKLPKDETFKFHEGSVLDSDIGRVQVVMLVSIAIDGNVKIVNKPRDMITIANGLAASGVPHLVEMLEGDNDKIWNLSNALVELLRKEKK